MSATRIELQASAAQTATGQGGQTSVANLSELCLMVDVTTVSASLTSVYLQGSSDGGTTWFDLLADSFVNTTTGSVAATSGTYARNMVSNLTTGAVIKAWGTYRAFGDLVRAAWTIAGSGPSCIFSVKAIGKN